ncbi:hemerythrin domain-containing protein [Actinophytocola xanthii]|uniref:Hemerythrin n=1 Tax=Actinophytocola xanthii TaxID=1912961 RepID=A0A1Q8CPN7_9PSEU|nr:hemerythrin domain-containing protein [Actinophytocola xanthii]OLF16333.1 hemerythrin [Actinophytocola xanthii]
MSDDKTDETTTDTSEDVIDLLCRQHEEIRRLFADLEQAPEQDRESLFADLVRLLSVHETAEQELIHPEIRAMEGGEEVVDARLAEEKRATELLETMTDIGPKAEGFDTLLIQLREDVLAHAEHEESAEFPILRQGRDRDRLVSLAGAVRAAERIAPTRPHPNVTSPAANFLLGPPLAIMDRARDAIRDALRR